MPEQDIKIATIVGARPQFVKAAVISRAIREHNESTANHQPRLAEVLIHTGQHYDYEMSQIFFDQLDLPKPDYHLEIGSGPHGDQTGRMMVRLEEVLMKEKPDWVLVYGDTNSTLAGALVASKLHIPIAHAEAGLRSYNRVMPEEINRVVADHLSQLLFCPTPTAVGNLKKEGIVKGVREVPDLMAELLHTSLKTAEVKSTVFNRLKLGGRYYLVTIHRPENTDSHERMTSLLEALSEIAKNGPVVWPIHPRTRKIIQDHSHLRSLLAPFMLIQPVSYIDMIMLSAKASIILTDSGGVQKEAFWLGVPCITLRDETEWVETVASGLNIVTGADKRKVLSAWHHFSEAWLPAKPPNRPLASAGVEHVRYFLELGGCA